MSDSPAAILYDDAGNPVSVVLDGGVYKIQLLSKLEAGAAIVGKVGIDAAEKGGLAEQATLAAQAADIALLEGKDFATETSLAAQAADIALLEGKDFATETTQATLATQSTLADVDAKLATIDAVLDSIKDTDGIKKITDELPAGTQEIGSVKQGTKAAAADAWPQVLYDAAGNPVTVTLDGGIYKLEVNATLLGDDNVVGQVKITNDDETFIAEVLPSGALQVVILPPENPAGTTAQDDEEVGEISSGNYENFTIPTGEFLTIQRFIAGCAGEGGKGAKVLLYYDEDGAGGVAQVEIARLYVQASTAILDMNWTSPRVGQSGDRIRIWRYPEEGSTQEVYGKWEGFSNAP